jgi:hypothetical protein
MALTAADKKEIETIVKKEIKDFLGEPTIKKYEDYLIKKLKKELKTGDLRGDLNDVIISMLSEFYYLMWTKKNTWQSGLKNKKS